MNIQEILANPKTHPIPESDADKLMICKEIAAAAKEEDIENCLEFAVRISDVCTYYVATGLYRKFGKKDSSLVWWKKFFLEKISDTNDRKEMDRKLREMKIAISTM